ncbi:MAG: hypothetical protein SynsKO_05590 [Synoicihabitans sp.]
MIFAVSSSGRAEWFTPQEVEAITVKGSDMTIEAEGTLFNRFEGQGPSEHIVEMTWPGGSFHGFRLSVLKDNRLPQNGPGWAPHGNFILSQISMAIEANDGQLSSIPIKHAYTDHEQDGWTLAGSITSDAPDSGWAIAGALGQDHQAYFAPESPIKVPANSRLRFTLAHGTSRFSNHQIGRFRIELTTSPSAVARYFSTRLRLTSLDDSPNDPFEVSIAKDGRIFYIERLGAIKQSIPATRSSITLGRLDVFSQLDDGLIGLTLDPNFLKNGWMYLCYSAPNLSENRVSRFTLREETLDLASEKILLRIPVQRDTPPCHTGGSLAFAPDDNLLISTGDNVNPFESEGYSPTDERMGRAAWDAQATAGNTRDLRGKILRITPQPDGSYTIPAGNLFSRDNPLARPEIYIMGCRNPFRMSVDAQTGTIYWGDIGPDAQKRDPHRGPPGYDEINQARLPGNYGWPFAIGANHAYHAFDYSTESSLGAFDLDRLKNTSPHNTGVRDLPSPKPALISYTYSHSPDTSLLGVGGRCVMAGPVYHFDLELDSVRKLPVEFDRHLFFYDWMRGRIIAAKLDENERPVAFRRILSGVPIRRPMDLELGPDGALYLVEWGTRYNGGNTDARISRIEAIPPGESDEAAESTVPHSQTQESDDSDYRNALAHGDAKTGEALLRNAHHLSCLNCHRLEDQGGVAGPALDGIGSRLSSTDILQEILHPARRVALGYGLVTLELKDGTRLAGVLVSESTLTTTIDTPESGRIEVTKDNIAVQSELSSTMPAFHGVLSPKEAADLVAYLASLREAVE